MRRLSALLGASVLTLAVLIPAASPTRAESACPEMDHFFTDSISFPAGFWTEGTHDITFDVPGVYTVTYSFVVDADAPVYPGQVILRPGEVDLEISAIDHTILTAVNPDQATVAQDTVTGPVDFLNWARMTFDESISWDSHPAVAAKESGIAALCLYGGPNKTTASEWLRAYGSRQR